MICSESFLSLLNGGVLSLSGLAALATGTMIALAYALSEMIQNPKVHLWAKTEAIQVVISAISAILLISVINGLCAINVADIASATSGASTTLAGTLSFFDAAETYLTNAAEYTHNVLKIERYYLGAFNMLEARARWYCLGASETLGGFSIFCFNNPSGSSYSPYAGFGTTSVAFNVAFNSALLSYLSSLNYLFILKFSLSGLALLLLPLGIFLRSMPFMRGLGGLFIAVAMSFFVVYPLMLAIFNFIPGLFDYQGIPSSYMDEGSLSAGIGDVLSQMIESDMVDYFFSSGGMYSTALGIAGRAFIVGVFLPTIALLATIGSVRYMSKLLGEEIDLSRIVQMV